MIIKLKEPVPDIGHDYYTPERILELFTPQKQYIVCAIILSGSEDDADGEKVRLLIDAQERMPPGKKQQATHPYLKHYGAPTLPALYPLQFFQIIDPQLPDNWMYRLRFSGVDLQDFEEKTRKELNIQNFYELKSLLSKCYSISTYPQGLDPYTLVEYQNLEQAYKAHAYLTPIYHQQRRLNADIEGYENP